MTDKVEQKNIEVKARIGDLRISPRKVRLVTDLLKKKTVAEAKGQLRLLSKKSAKPILKLINSAVANAVHNFQMNPDKLRIQNLTVDAGQVTLRFRPRAQGRVSPVRHRTSIVQIVLVDDPKIKVKTRKILKPVVKEKVTQKDEIESDEKLAKEGIKEDQAKNLPLQPKGQVPDLKRGKGIRKGFVDIKKRLFNRKTNA
ncbi:MAG: 50S ribosomal protein L22 [Candidatus Doudnabacteria bacterium CG10_big_fil_rev_8_21_14_0_10_41_10]|uniref:Large ribosomal subunit protein uL22 n=1 Tax=Candidatus Doudnabacteria bacterium CG10_big_fil_rev_8_21_14_0_10_41_10 TaxID=1974551 RepID=A0A2H0VDH8_9BACT|nr:MAG: 50S ribosomal protein L22 [Candidatus Doudnabacteria bacterium CG10_big_fil_rev_8_21_14_0_10_41_10]